MNKLKMALVAALALPSFSVLAEEQVKSEESQAKSEHSFDYSLGVYSQYIFRGLTQTNEKPALQGSADYSHESGLYAGTWFSTISWLRDDYGGRNGTTSGGAGYDDDGRLEMDFYAGFANEFGETGIGYDLGILYYWYPGDVRSGFAKANTTELYGALSYGWVTLKNSWVITESAWQWGKPSGSSNSANSSARGTTYTDLSAAIPLSEVPGFKDTKLADWTVNLHWGYQNFDGKMLAGVDEKYIDYQDVLIGFNRTIYDDYEIGYYHTHSNTKKSTFNWDGKNVGGDHDVFYISKSF